MATLTILSAGAAQAVTERIVGAFKRETGNRVVANFGAVGAMKASITAGEKVDVIILTSLMIDELISAGVVEPTSKIDLGKVATGVAVRARTPPPAIATPDALKSSLRAATRIVCPDPAIATAGKVVMSMMEKLGVLGEVRGRLEFFPNGYAAMNALAKSRVHGEIGITQVTEILPNKGVAYAGPLPDEFQMKTVYSAGVATRASEPALARDFISRFASPASRGLLVEAGYELEK